MDSEHSTYVFGGQQLDIYDVAVPYIDYSIEAFS